MESKWDANICVNDKFECSLKYVLFINGIVSLQDLAYHSELNERTVYKFSLYSTFVSTLWNHWSCKSREFRTSCLRHDFTNGRQKYDMDFRWWPPVYTKSLTKYLIVPPQSEKQSECKTPELGPPVAWVHPWRSNRRFVPWNVSSIVCKCFQGPWLLEENCLASIFPPEYSNGPITIKIFDFWERGLHANPGP